MPIFLVDAFVAPGKRGNPAAVVPLDGPREDGWMARVAEEMNQTETAFFWPEGNGYRLRWFTPTVEVDLCGHATLASAHVLDEAEVRFHTRSGDLLCRREGSEIAMNFPAEAPGEAALPHDVGLSAVWTGHNRMDHFIQVATEAEVRGYVPNLNAIAALGMRGLIVSAPARNTDFVSRCFFPQSGVDEDSVTGSAHCALAPYWAERLSRQHLVGEQASRRGGIVRCRCAGDRVELRGQAQTTLQGELLL